MNFKPILYNTEMVRAILDDRKTMTRRPFKNAPASVDLYDIQKHNKNYILSQCPYGKPGDILWVRETWQHTKILHLSTDDENYGYAYKATDQPWEDYEGWTWRPSIHMPREACRLYLKIKDVYVQRLKDLSEEDAIREGFQSTAVVVDTDHGKDYTGLYASEHFFSAWEDIYGPQASYRSNPWVWVIEFERIDPCDKKKL